MRGELVNTCHTVLFLTVRPLQIEPSQRGPATGRTLPASKGFQSVYSCQGAHGLKDTSEFSFRLDCLTPQSAAGPCRLLVPNSTVLALSSRGDSFAPDIFDH